MSSRPTSWIASAVLVLARSLSTASARAPVSRSSMVERLTVSELNPAVIDSAYAVRGPVLDRALQLQATLKSDPDALPFDEIVQCNIGNPQLLGQSPISYFREVLTLCINPSMLESIGPLLKPDVVARAQQYIRSVPSMGAYTHSQGIEAVRQEVADFIQRRDETDDTVNVDNIFLTNGASEGVRIVMQTIMRPAIDGVLVPIPQYPLYSATCTLLNGHLVPYYLNEGAGWALTKEHLQHQLDQATGTGVQVKALVVINPGNPTGQTLSRANMEEVISFCAEHGLVLMADEVYQENIWRAERPFLSFRKVACEMGFDASPESGLQLISYHSVSKGFTGECGIRGGYFELFGIDPEVKAQMYKLASISLCSNTPGQLVTGMMVNPPQPGDASYDTYVAERDGVLASLKRRADMVADALDQLEGVTCRRSDGAMYAFPTITLPDKFVAEAEAEGLPADEYYCIRLVEATGVVVVPGSGFGQVDGTWHFRTTFLPPESKITGVLGRISAFHASLMADYK